MTHISISTMEGNERAMQTFETSALLGELFLELETLSDVCHISASDLFRMAQGKMVPDRNFSLLDTSSSETRSAYVQMLTQTAAYHLPPPMAASSTEIAVRDGSGCRLRFETSRAEPDQVYIIIELTNRSADIPLDMIVCDSDNNCQSIPLPTARDGIIQLISQRNSPLMDLLSDPRTEVYLR